MKTFVASKTHLGEDGQIVRRGQAFRADDKRERALRKRGLIGKDSERRTFRDARDRDSAASAARSERRLRKAFGIFQRAGVIPAEVQFESILEEVRRRGGEGGPFERREPEPRRTQAIPDPAPPPPPVERQTKAEGEGQDETPPPAPGEGEGGQEGAGGSEGDDEGGEGGTDDDQAGEGEEGAPPPPEPPVNPETGRRMRGNRNG
jgi:hypothetical protein